jgi:hypothetical protein
MHNLAALSTDVITFFGADRGAKLPNFTDHNIEIRQTTLIVDGEVCKTEKFGETECMSERSTVLLL